MRIIPIEVESDFTNRGSFKAQGRSFTLLLSILHFDWPGGDMSLLEIGWWRGVFQWEIFFHRMLIIEE